MVDIIELHHLMWDTATAKERMYSCQKSYKPGRITLCLSHSNMNANNSSPISSAIAIMHPRICDTGKRTLNCSIGLVCGTRRRSLADCPRLSERVLWSSRIDVISAAQHVKDTSRPLSLALELRFYISYCSLCCLLQSGRLAKNRIVHTLTCC